MPLFHWFKRASRLITAHSITSPITRGGRCPERMLKESIDMRATNSLYFAWKCGGLCSLWYMKMIMPKNRDISDTLCRPSFVVGNAENLFARYFFIKRIGANVEIVRPCYRIGFWIDESLIKITDIGEACKYATTDECGKVRNAFDTIFEPDADFITFKWNGWYNFQLYHLDYIMNCYGDSRRWPKANRRKNKKAANDKTCATLYLYYIKL